MLFPNILCKCLCIIRKLSRKGFFLFLYLLWLIFFLFKILSTVLPNKNNFFYVFSLKTNKNIKRGRHRVVQGKKILKRKRYLNKTLKKRHVKTMESILCWLTISEHKACPAVWLIYTVSLHWRKLFFFPVITDITCI